MREIKTYDTDKGKNTSDDCEWDWHTVPQLWFLLAGFSLGNMSACLISFIIQTYFKT